MRANIKIAFVFAHLFALLNGNFAFAQQPVKNIRFFDSSKKFSISVYTEYVSSSVLQDNIQSSDPIERNATIDLKGGIGYGGEINYTPSILDHDLTFFLSSEYLKIDQSDLALRFYQDTVSAAVRIEEKFYLVPIEIGVKWNLPIGTDNFKIYIGGGGGLYFGDRQRIIGGLFKSSTISRTPGFSLNILSGMLLYIAENLSANFELKFREASYDVQSSFNINTINIGGIDFAIQNPLYSRVIINGVKLSLGLKYNF